MAFGNRTKHWSLQRHGLNRQQLAPHLCRKRTEQFIASIVARTSACVASFPNLGQWLVTLCVGLM
jgi:hypothetical protein